MEENLGVNAPTLPLVSLCTFNLQFSVWRMLLKHHEAVIYLISLHWVASDFLLV